MGTFVLIRPTQTFYERIKLLIASAVVPSVPRSRRLRMKGITVVIPPKAALTENESIRSVFTGWLWASTAPGSTYLPEASMVPSRRPVGEIRPHLVYRLAPHQYVLLGDLPTADNQSAGDQMVRSLRCHSCLLPAVGHALTSKDRERYSRYRLREPPVTNWLCLHRRCRGVRKGNPQSLTNSL